MFHRKKSDAPPALNRALRGTLAGMWVERLVRAFWPFSSLLLLAAAALGFGAQDHLPLLWANIAAIMLLVALLGALLVGAWRLRVPFPADAARRLDQALPGRPLSALSDQQAIGAQDAASTRVWAVHMARMQARLAHVDAVRADLRLSRFDRFGLRYIALTAFAVSLLFGAPTRVGEISELAQIPGRAEAVALGPSWEAWVQPPAYTGRPSLYLNEVDRARLELPQGSRVTVRFYGQQGIMSVHESLSDRQDPDTTDMAQDFEIDSSGRLSIRGPGGRDWEVAALADQPPTVALDGAAQRERGGLMRQDFTAADDYGVVEGRVHIDLDLANVSRDFGLAVPPEPRAALSVALPLPVSGSRTEFSDAFIEDFSQHPWANMPVTVALQVEDARGQQGHSQTMEMTLPGRRFFDPMAAAIIELRRDLLWSGENATRAGQLMRAIGHHPQDAFRGVEARIRFTETRDLLLASLDDGGLDGATRDDLAQRMWDLAVLLEEGELADARERLQRAQERLDEAVRSGADPSEVAELMDELREAMRDYMRQLAEQPRERGEAPPDGESMEITQDQIQQLLDRIQELMEEGRMDEAAQLLAQLQALLENLQMAEGQGGEGMPGNEAMEGLGDALRDQQDLADDTFNDLQDQFRNGDDDLAPDGAPSTDELAQRQRGLADQLRDQQLAPLPGEGTAEGDAALEALERAQRAMEDAAEALEQGESGEALNRQADAMEAMRDGLRAMNEAATQNQRDQQQGEQGTEQGGDGGRDPLGRDRNQGGDVGTDQDMLQGGDTYRRAQDLLEELRRRSAERDRPEAELDYLRRLLDRF
ncbi:DUF4175 domain-containing protein [Roseinatronobacter sp. S2]|uniref:DUF4175 domain-containing protein n=1 Tax=Roseinatronobacter sp. S2 TaxID=3035471 RepID=UPI00240E9F09|nr:DUF4175 family protein [Roseinatronobacter sp. S2]WFE75361.1 DUF4175 family protein [Roseinatronobacter sp. S2]